MTFNRTNSYLRKRVLANGRIAWQIAIATGYSEVEENGEKKRRRDFVYRTVHGPRSVASRIMREMQNEIEANNGKFLVSECSMKLSDWNKQWLRDFTQHVEASTRNGYRTLLDYVARSPLARKPISKLSLFAFQEFFSSLTVASSKGTGSASAPKRCVISMQCSGRLLNKQ